MTEVNGESILLIGKNLASLTTLSLPKNVKTINVHCNNINKIEGLKDLKCLEHFDISSNKLTTTIGLKGLASLKYLNLASNFITEVESFEDLTQLVYLNLSYNKITSLRGLVELHGSNSQLETIELHCNDIGDANHVITCLQGIISLKHLVLKMESEGNPLCDDKDYRKKIMNNLPQLQSLDYVDRCGNQVEFPVHDELFSIDGSTWEYDIVPPVTTKEHVIDDIFQPLLSEISISTPHIDAALANHRSSNNMELITDDDRRSIANLNEQKNKQLRFSSASNEYNSNDTMRSTLQEITEEKVDENSPVVVSSKTTPKKHNQPVYTTTSSEQTNRKLSTNRLGIPVKKQAKVSKPKKKPLVQKRITTTQPLKCERVNENINRHVEKETYLNLLKELEAERERRWKAEQASRKLVIALRDMQAENSEGKSLQNMASNTAERLKQTLLNERDSNNTLKQENQACKEKIIILEEKLNAVGREKAASIRTLQNALSKTNVELSKLKSLRSKEKQEFECKLTTSKSYQDLMKTKNEQLQTQVNDLQNLLTNREAEYKKSLSGMYSMDNTNFCSAIELHTKEIEKRHNQDMNCFKYRIQTLQYDYSQLENEFREALYIESERYKTLVDKFNKSDINVEKYEALLKSLSEKEGTSRSMIVEMTSIIKEQKAKIGELAKCKEEFTKHYKDRIKSLEHEKAEDNKKAIELELVKQEKSRLLSQLTASQSVINGLKEERKVWGQELAQQGSSLAQDRGRLEMKIASLQAEISSMRKGNERDLDALRIKTKVVEDQTQTIHKLKDALVGKDKEIRLKLEEELRVQHQLQETIEDLTQDNASLQEDKHKLEERKQQLKDMISDLSKDQETLQADHEKLKRKWVEKGSLLSKLELQVKSITEAAKQREIKIIEERDNAIKLLQVTKDKIDQLAFTYDEQLKASNVAHVREMECLQRDKREEIDRLQSKIYSVEREMTDLLKENEQEKNKMKDRIFKLKSMFQELSP